MRKQNLSLYDIERSLKDNGTPLSGHRHLGDTA
jgi:hypothetical protein